MKKILLLGGAGYIGGALSNLLMHYNRDFLVVDNLLYEHRFLKSCSFKNLDIRNYSELKNFINDFDVVYMLAGIVGDAACSVDRELTNDINFNSVKWLTDNFKNKIIFPSTCSVYGRNDNLLDEESAVNPQSFYAESKLLAEEYLLKNRPDSLVFRLGTLFGIGDGFCRPRLDLVVNLLTLKAARNEALTVYSGEQWRPLLHVNDVASAMLWGLDQDLTGLYNLAQCNLTIRDIAKTISQLTNNCDIKYTEIPFEDRRNYRVDTSKISSTGWAPHIALDTGIKQMYNTFCEDRIRNPFDRVYHNGHYIRSLYGKA